MENISECSPLPCVGEGSHKTLFLVFGLAAKPLSNQNERGLPPIRIEWECALVCMLLACCTSPHCRVCACAYFVTGVAGGFSKITQITYYTFKDMGLRMRRNTVYATAVA